MRKDLQELVESFALFDNWEDRYRYLIDMGQRLPVMDENLKTEENMVRGCTSQVWLVSRIQGGRFHLLADSDALIVKGLIYILLVAYEGKTAEEIRATDITGAFERLGLDRHLSPNRRNGFFAMVGRIQDLAEIKNQPAA